MSKAGGGGYGGVDAKRIRKLYKYVMYRIQI